MRNSIKNKYLLTAIITISSTFLQGTAHSSETQGTEMHSFQLHRLMLSGDADKTPYRIALSDAEITEIRGGNMDSLKQKLNELDFRREQKRYDYITQDGVIFENDKLIVTSAYRQDHTRFRPIEIVEFAELKLQLLDPRINGEVHCFAKSVRADGGILTSSDFFRLCNRKISDESGEYFCTSEELSKFFSFDEFHLIISANNPIILDGIKIGIFDWLGHEYKIKFSSLTDTLIFAQDMAERMNVTTPEALNLLCSYYSRIYSPGAISREPGTENSYYLDSFKILQASERHDYCSIRQVRVRFTTTEESADWYDRVGQTMDGLEDLPQNGFIHSIIIADKEFSFTGNTHLNEQWIVNSLVPVLRSISDIRDEVLGNGDEHLSILRYPIEELYKRIDFDRLFSGLAN